MTVGKLAQVPSGSLLGRALRLPLRLIPKHSVVTVRSGLNAGMKWVVGASVHGCWLGHYELEKQALVRRLVKPGMQVLDIGANAGFYTLAFSRLVGDSGRVWAFEPYAHNASNLLWHLQLNSIGNVTLVQAAVTDRQGIIGFRIAGNNSMGAVTDRAGTYAVPAVTLDALTEDGTLPMPDVIKMDVEGAESRVLRGAKRLLARRSTSFLIAIHGWEQMQACLSLLRGAGYTAYGLDGQCVTDDQPYVDEIYASPASMQSEPTGEMSAGTAS